MASTARDSFYLTLDKCTKSMLEGPAMHIHWNLLMPIDFSKFPVLKEAAFRASNLDGKKEGS